MDTTHTPRYLQCTTCRAIHRAGALEHELVDLLTLRGYCPDCGADSFRPAARVCDRCERAPALAHDDYCAPCALVIDLVTARPVELTAPEFVS